MKLRTASILSLVLLSAAAPAAFGQSSQPLLVVNMTEIRDLTTSSYWGVNTNDYLPPPYAQLGSVNGGYGQYTDTLELIALATGTFPAGGFTYTFYVNGQSIGTAVNAPTSNNDPYTQGVGWTPPQPGTYYFSCVASDGLGHTATSLPVEYFAEGVAIVSPLPNAIVPLGSSVVIQAAAAINAGAVSRVDFKADGVVIASSVNYPYSVIYTPPTMGVHFISATSYLSDGVTQGGTTGVQGIQVVSPVLPLPLCTISSPAQTSPPTTIPIPDYEADSSAYVPVLVNAGGANNITEVQLYINGVLFQTLSALPYNFKWQPTVAGTYNLTALAYDGKNNVIASTTSTTATVTPAPTTVVVGSLPSVAITTPTNDATISGQTTMVATATDTNVSASGSLVSITSVQFYQDGVAVGSANGPTPNGQYTISFTPTQKVNATTGLAEDSTLTAIATDALNFQGVSAGVQVQVLLGGSSGGVVLGTPPTISLTAPANSATVVVNTPVTLSATAAAANGNVNEVDFYVDGTVLTKVVKYPYSTTWTPANLGFYTITATVIDNLGDKTNSSPITVNVTSEPPPTVSLSGPTSGEIVTVGAPITVTASAGSSASSTIAQVQFYENGVLIGTATTSPYSVTFTPPSTGIYTITAVATDSSGEVTTSSAVEVEAAPASTAVGTTVYFGNYQGIHDSGIFALAINDGVLGTYIGIPTSASQTAITYIPDMSVNSGGAFESPDGSISGTAEPTGTTGTIVPANDIFIGAILTPATYTVASGYYTGNLGGVAGSNVAAVVGADGSIFVYVGNGGYQDAGGEQAAIDSNGEFSIPTYRGNTITGKVNPATSLITAGLSGPNGGTILAAKVSGGTFSDGVLKNLSTRGSVGSGSNALIAGFVVGGSANKQLLVRAAGPALSGFGISGAVAGTQLTIMNSSNAVLAANSGWSSSSANATAVSAADSAAGAFAFAPGSADSAIVGTFPPGAYTATVTGAGGDTGIGLVEVYDLDAFSPFTANKLVDVATRGDVGTGGSVLIAGFVINGTAPKRVLIRGDGPALTAFAVSGALATPHLQLYNNAGTVIRENYSWVNGNDIGLVQAAEKASGAFQLANPSLDSVILITLNPGTYTVEVSGANASTGNAIVEIYEVD